MYFVRSDQMSGTLYCPGYKWDCEVADYCKHNNARRSHTDYITPKFVCKTGCIYFMEDKDV